MSATYAARPATLAAPRVAASRSGGGVRLTRRGRIVVLVLALLVLGLLGVAWGATSSASDEAGPAATETIRVASGDTLWEIASERAGGGESVQDVIDDIRDLNSLDSGALQAGDLLVVPIAA